jgi:hypothetical protein
MRKKPFPKNGQLGVCLGVFNLSETLMFGFFSKTEHSSLKLYIPQRQMAITYSTKKI